MQARVVAIKGQPIRVPMLIDRSQTGLLLKLERGAQQLFRLREPAPEILLLLLKTPNAIALPLPFQRHNFLHFYIPRLGIAIPTTRHIMVCLDNFGAGIQWRLVSVIDDPDLSIVPVPCNQLTCQIFHLSVHSHNFPT
jgi:hypothetical protein